MIYYEDIYRSLEKCFVIAFGDGKTKKGMISMKEVRELLYMRMKADLKNNLPENSLMDVPYYLFDELKKTYISRDTSYASGPIGCAESPEEQEDGIYNMALLIYLSNHLSKGFRIRAENETDNNKVVQYNKYEKNLLINKDIALKSIIASIYILSKTSEEHNNYFSYGRRLDDNGKSTLVIDLPYIGQICVHFGWKEKENEILDHATKIVKSILKEKYKLGQISKEQYQHILSDLGLNGVLPQYEGKLYEYVGAMPIEYIGDKIKKYRGIIDFKMPEDITSEDINKLIQSGLNERELYYFLIKNGATKELLTKALSEKNKITPEFIEKATSDTTIEDFNNGKRDMGTLLKGIKERSDNTFTDE